MPALFRAEKKSRRRSTKKGDTWIRIVSASKAGSVLTLVFDQPVSLRRGLVPQYATSVAGAEPVSAALTNPTTLAVTFDAAITAATSVTIPVKDPAVRS